MNASATEDDIPVLTDIVSSEMLGAAQTAVGAGLETTQRLATLTQAHEPAAVAPDSEVWLDALAARVQSRVLAGLTTRIDPIVEQCLRESLTDLLEQVLAGMTAELKVTARNIVRDAVAQAVAAELAALHIPTDRVSPAPTKLN